MRDRLVAVAPGGLRTLLCSEPARVISDGDDLELRVPGHHLITEGRVEPNASGTCAWVAVSLLLRYWDGRFPGAHLLPAAYRMPPKHADPPDLSVALRGRGGSSSWAGPVSARLQSLIARRGVRARASWRPGALGITRELEAGRPVLLFGYLPKIGRPGRMAHAVLVYGRTTRGHYLAHYGYEGCAGIILTRGIAGSSARLRLV